MAQAAGVNSGGPNHPTPVQMPPQVQPVPSQKQDSEGNNTQPPGGNICFHCQAQTERSVT